MNEHSGPSTAVTVPRGLPVLTAGRHRRPEHGACVMEYVSVLAGESWSDAPGCTDRVLAELARWVNDDVGRDARTALAELASRLIGAVAPAASDIVVAAVARVGLGSAPDDRSLIRIHRRARARLAAADLPSRPSERAAGMRRALLGTGLPTTYRHLAQAVCGHPQAERDAVRVRALTEALEDIRSAASRARPSHEEGSAVPIRTDGGLDSHAKGPLAHPRGTR